uniref:Poliovirus receptor-related protein 2-like protein n=1 Tax=Callorhinchus milii TaxID=7868 RepID=V9KRK8_CALMI
MRRFSLLFIFVLLKGVCGEHVRVEPWVSVTVGSSLLLRCELMDQEKGTSVTQVSWVFNPNEVNKVNLAVFNPDHGVSYAPELGTRVTFRNPPSLQDPSLIVNPVLATDAGIYSCEIATYPHGTLEGHTNLTVLVKPRNTAAPVMVRAGGTSEQAVARCVSQGGKPRAEISWEPPGLPGFNVSTVSVQNADSTYTVTSELLTLPTPEIYQQSVDCVVKQAALDKPDRLSVSLTVQFSPVVTVLGYDNNWYLGREDVILTCKSHASPPATKFTWSHNSAPVSDHVRATDHRLVVPSVTSDLNGTFTCSATNEIGSGSSSVRVEIRETSLGLSGSTTGAIVGGIIAAVVILAVVVTTFMIFRRHRKNRTETDDDLDPPSYKPPPPKKITEDNSEAVVKFINSDVSEVEPLNAAYYETSREASPGEMTETKFYTEIPDGDEKLNFSPSDNYIEQLNPIYNELSFKDSDDTHSGFISKGMYV